MFVAVLGAAGSTGKAIVPELLRRGHRVRVVGRDAGKLRAAFGADVDVVSADLMSSDEARRALAGVDAVVYAVGVPYPEFAKHPVLSAHALDAARGERVKLFLHIGTVYAYGRPRSAEIDESQPREPHTRKGGFRRDQENLVLAADTVGGMRTLIVRFPDFYGPDAELSFVRAVTDGAKSGKTANVVGPIDTVREWWFVPDTGAIVADLLDNPDTFGTDYNVQGERATTRRFAELAYARHGGKPKLMAAQPWLVRIIGLFDPFMREVGEMTYLWTTPVLVSDAKLRGVLGSVHRTPLAEGIAATVG